MSLGRDVYSLPRTYKRVSHAKEKARPELRKFGWDTLGYSGSFKLPPLKDTITRVDGRTITVKEFRRDYERPSIPIILTGLTDEWTAKEKWTMERLSKKYRNQNFKCGEDDDGNSVRMKMKYYHDYSLNTTDDSPLYIFDSSFAERRKTKKLSEDYSVPKFFEDDLFRYADNKKDLRIVGS
uniref:Cupin_8 domain-containing protein n=1 Tax=Caenorhabditis tropicalis TaxID=1561998 RepID=A0A1I7TDX6_9PELO